MVIEVVVDLFVLRRGPPIIAPTTIVIITNFYLRGFLLGCDCSWCLLGLPLVLVVSQVQ
jgi:hypothetical protein